MGLYQTKASDWSHCSLSRVVFRLNHPNSIYQDQSIRWACAKLSETFYTYTNKEAYIRIREKTFCLSENILSAIYISFGNLDLSHWSFLCCAKSMIFSLGITRFDSELDDCCNNKMTKKQRIVSRIKYMKYKCL